MLNRILKIGAIMVTGLFLAVFTYQSYGHIKDQIYLASDINNVFIVHSVVVPDFILGEDPPVQYDRDILQNFIGDYRVELKFVLTGETVCFGSGDNVKYDIGEKSPDHITFTWFMNTVCDPRKILPGQYYLEVNYDIRIEGSPARTYVKQSNVFTIFPPGYK